MLIRLHTAMTLDGFSANADGWPVLAGMPDFVPGVSYGHDEFIQQCEAVMVGRTTFDSGLAAPHWPWPGKRMFVLTTRPVTAPDGVDVVACASAADALDRVRNSGMTGDVHLLGGPSTIAAMYRIGAIDTLEIIILPVLQGTGTPLFPFADTADRLELIERCGYPDGTTKLRFTRA
ncbi:MAG TPA: dihydrofolate reductase family protein [Pseudonocardiaceae bacterium]|nr:dihydrofolate reductase family protein [Pseudonocardiaceae bacterium]